MRMLLNLFRAVREWRAEGREYRRIECEYYKQTEPYWVEIAKYTK